MPVIKNSLHVKFEFDFACAISLAWELDTRLNAKEIPLPVEEITEWLVNKRKGNQVADCQKRREKFLQIKLRKIRNGAQMCERLRRTNV